MSAQKEVETLRALVDKLTDRINSLPPGDGVWHVGAFAKGALLGAGAVLAWFAFQQATSSPSIDSSRPGSASGSPAEPASLPDGPKKEVAVRSTTNSGVAVYESSRAVEEYLQFHYAPASDILPYDFGPVTALGILFAFIFFFFFSFLFFSLLIWVNFVIFS
jgi:hypothetical protein